VSASPRRTRYLAFGTAIYLQCVKCGVETIHTRLRCCHCQTLVATAVELTPSDRREFAKTMGPRSRLP
jgi:uncharacterized OB-fold protein